MPSAPEIQAAVGSGIQPLGEVFGLGQLEFGNDPPVAGFVRHWVLAGGKPLFSIDLTGIAGSVLKSQIVKHPIAAESDKIVLSPTAKYLLFQKCETFLNQRFLKARDGFDIHLLVGRGVHLDKNLHAHLEDFILMREFDEAFIVDRIKRTDSKLCTAGLRPVLPAAIFEDLGRQDFEPMRQSLRTVFADWL